MYKRQPTTSRSFSVDEWKFPSDLKLADPQFYKSSHVDILFGANTFWQNLLPSRVNISSGIYAHHTKFGWLITGYIPLQTVQGSSQCHFTNADLHQRLEKFWQIESIESAPSLSSEDEFCEQHFLETTVRNPDGRFIVTMPRISSPPPLCDSYPKALKALFAVENQLKQDPSTRKQYFEFMEDYEASNHM